MTSRSPMFPSCWILIEVSGFRVPSLFIWKSFPKVAFCRCSLALGGDNENYISPVNSQSIKLKG